MVHVRSVEKGKVAGFSVLRDVLSRLFALCLAGRYQDCLTGRIYVPNESMQGHLLLFPTDVKKHYYEGDHDEWPPPSPTKPKPKPQPKEKEKSPMTI